MWQRLARLSAVFFEIGDGQVMSVWSSMVTSAGSFLCERSQGALITALLCGRPFFLCTYLAEVSKGLSGALQHGTSLWLGCIREDECI